MPLTVTACSASSAASFAPDCCSPSRTNYRNHSVNYRNHSVTETFRASILVKELSIVGTSANSVEKGSSYVPKWSSRTSCSSSLRSGITWWKFEFNSRTGHYVIESSGARVMYDGILSWGSPADMAHVPRMGAQTYFHSKPSCITSFRSPGTHSHAQAFSSLQRLPPAFPWFHPACGTYARSISQLSQSLVVRCRGTLPAPGRTIRS